METPEGMSPQLTVEGRVPTGEEYKEANQALMNAQQERDRLFASLLPTQGEERKQASAAYNEANTEYHKAKDRLAKMKELILENTDAVEYDGGLVVLSHEQGPHAPGIKVVETYGGGRELSGIKPGSFFTPDLSNAPKAFKEAMYKGPFTIRLDGTLGELYRKMPDTTPTNTSTVQVRPKAA